MKRPDDRPKVKFRSVYDPSTAKAEDFAGAVSMTRQEFTKESDINTMMEKYERTGIAPPPSGRPYIYGDFSDPALTDYMEAQKVVRGAGELMQSLPAKTRERFGNDVAELIQFVSDARNRKEAIELGLINAPPTPAEEPKK